MLREYGDSIGEIYKRLIHQDEIKEIVGDLRLAHTIAVATSANTKEGNVQYNRWRQRKVAELQDKQEEETMTVFEKLKKSRGQGSNTIFSKLKRMAKKRKKHGV